MNVPIAFPMMRVVAIVLSALLWACNPSGKKAKVIAGDDDLTSGTIHISVDESFRPVIDSQIKVFESQYPKAHIIAHYKAEAECIKDLLNDSIRMVIITRGLSEEEVNFYKDTLEFPPIFGQMASDAIATVVHPDSKDSLFSLADIRGMLNGTSGYRYQLVMDGLTATSTVRYMLDSVLRGGDFKGQVVAAKTSAEVLDYVATHPASIGFVGVSWIGNREDSTQLSFLQKVRIAALQCGNCDKEVYVKPYQANIALKRYPMIRGLYYVLKENYAGLGKGFANFLTHEKGQLIFRRAYLVPDRMRLEVRLANATE
jgi:phosphate transport system substrate-binding protein